MTTLSGRYLRIVYSQSSFVHIQKLRVKSLITYLRDPNMLPLGPTTC